MAKYKIEKQYIFSNKDYNQVCTFFQQFNNIDLSKIKDHKGNTALHQASYNSSDIRILIKYLQYMEKYLNKTNLNDPQGAFRQFVNCYNDDGLTALHFAAYKGHYKALQILCNHGADYTKNTKSGQNVLHMAAQGGMVEAFVFFQSLVDINSKDRKNSTPLHWAAYMNSQSIVTYLLTKSNLQINAQDENEQTALHLAAAYGHLKIVKKLLRAGADRNIKNKSKQTALKIARDNQFKNIEGVLNQKYTCCDFLKLYLNLKTEYKPASRSIIKPTIYIICLLLFTAIRILFFKLVQKYQFIRYAQLGLLIIVLSLYLSLITKPKKAKPEKFINFLNGGFSLKRICLACAQLKPSRSFHCQVCKTCIQRYDHHCFWINNCVGKRNLKRFVSFIIIFQFFLLYVLAFSVLTLISILGEEEFIFMFRNQKYMTICTIYLFLIGLFALGFSFPMVSLIVVHIKNIFMNKTTYERFTKDKISTLTESTSHLLSQELALQKTKKYSLSNARTMCIDDSLEQDNINSSIHSHASR